MRSDETTPAIECDCPDGQEENEVQSFVWAVVSDTIYAIMIVAGAFAVLSALCGLGLIACMTALPLFALATSPKPAALLIILPISALLGWIFWLHRSVHKSLEQT